jgi:hypothetical protein
MKALKDLLIRDVINPLLDPEKYRKFKLSIPNGLLLAIERAERRIAHTVNYSQSNAD